MMRWLSQAVLQWIDAAPIGRRRRSTDVRAVGEGKLHATKWTCDGGSRRTCERVSAGLEEPVRRADSPHIERTGAS